MPANNSTGAGKCAAGVAASSMFSPRASCHERISAVDTNPPPHPGTDVSSYLCRTALAGSEPSLTGDIDDEAEQAHVSSRCAMCFATSPSPLRSQVGAARGRAEQYLDAPYYEHPSEPAQIMPHAITSYSLVGLAETIPQAVPTNKALKKAGQQIPTSRP